MPSLSLSAQWFSDLALDLLPLPTTITMSLLQGVLKSKTEEIEKRLNIIRLDGKQRTPYDDKDDSDDDLVNVVRLRLLSSEFDREL